MTLSVCIITYNEEANIGRTLASVQELVRTLGGEIIVVDSGSTDRTREIAESFGLKVFVEEWKGFAAQKNSAIAKATGDWILSLDADEEVSSELAAEIGRLFPTMAEWARNGMPVNMDPVATRMRDEGMAWGIDHEGDSVAFSVPRKNLFLGRWIRHGGFWPDRKTRLFRRGAVHFENRLVHEDLEIKSGQQVRMLFGALLHHAYPTLDVYLEHMRRYADLGAEMIRHKPPAILLLNRWLNPPLTFLYNYIFRLGFLDGREGFLLHWNHSRYVSWKYAKALELSRNR